MKKNPYFTVVIPTYNRANLVKEAIESVFSQTLQDFELIVVDDHSTDNTRELIDSFYDNRITYVLNDHNKGAAGARNAGVFRAHGEWVAFLDSDDIWSPDKLELVYKKIVDSDKTVGLIYTGFAYYDFTTNKEVRVIKPIKEGYIQNDLIINNCIGTFSVATIRTDLLLKVNGLDERIHNTDDMDLYIRIADFCKISLLNKTLTYYRYENTDRITMNQKNKLKDFCILLNKYSSIYKKYPNVKYFATKRTFLLALNQKEWTIMLKTLPWMLTGIFYDTSYFLQVIKRLLFTSRKS